MLLTVKQDYLGITDVKTIGRHKASQLSGLLLQKAHKQHCPGQVFTVQKYSYAVLVTVWVAVVYSFFVFFSISTVMCNKKRILKYNSPLSDNKDVCIPLCRLGIELNSIKSLSFQQNGNSSL